MRFLFRLDLSLHAGAGKKFGIWKFATKQGPTQVRGRKNKNIKDMDIYFLTDKERLNSDSHIIFEYLNIF